MLKAVKSFHQTAPDDFCCALTENLQVNINSCKTLEKSFIC